MKKYSLKVICPNKLTGIILESTWLPTAQPKGITQVLGISLRIPF
jgi:hypothetical protein